MGGEDKTLRGEESGEKESNSHGVREGGGLLRQKRPAKGRLEEYSGREE